MNALIERLVERHLRRYGVEPGSIAYAPGRVEILGNHTDYNEGFVLSAAIDSGVAYGLTGSGSADCRLYSADFDRTAVCSAADPGRSDEDRWSNYSRGVLAFLRERFGFEPQGFLGTQIGDIPIGAGLSSSAALEIASGLAMAAFYGLEPEPLELARIGQRAEHEYAGVKCGLLDQISSLFGRSQALVFTDFRSLEVRTVALPPGTSFLIAHTAVKHALVDSEYNERRQRCEEAAAYFGRVLGTKVRALRDVSWDDLEAHRGVLDPAVWRRAAHPIGENDRVLKGVRMLEDGDTAGFGRLMFESHKSSMIYFENSCPELDTLVEAARTIPGVLGARLSGGGFGGSIVALVESERIPAAGQALAQAYEREYGHAIEPREVIPSAGARLVRRP